MFSFPLNATDEQLLMAVDHWIGLLAEERYEEAFKLLYLNSPLDDGWSPDLIRALVQNYGISEPCRDGKVHRVTPIAQTSGGRPNPCRMVFRYDDDNGAKGLEGYIHFDLPLDGEWSDVTASFDIWRIEDKLVLHLEDMHVL